MMICVDRPPCVSKAFNVPDILHGRDTGRGTTELQGCAADVHRTWMETELGELADFGVCAEAGLIISRPMSGIGDVCSDADGGMIGDSERTSSPIMAEPVEVGEAVDEVDELQPQICCVCTNDNQSSASAGEVVLCAFMPHALSSALCTVAAVTLSSAACNTVSNQTKTSSKRRRTDDQCSFHGQRGVRAAEERRAKCAGSGKGDNVERENGALANFTLNLWQEIQNENQCEQENARGHCRPSFPRSSWR